MPNRQMLNTGAMCVYTARAWDLKHLGRQTTNN